MINSFVGETCRADRMLLNMLAAHQLQGMTSNNPFWDKLDQTQDPNNLSQTVSLNISFCDNLERKTIRSSEFENYGNEMKLIT